MSAVDGLVQVIPFLGFGIAAVVHTHQPGAAAASDNLTDFSCHKDTSSEVRHTNGTLRKATQLTCWGLQRWGLIGVQSLHWRRPGQQSTR